MMGQYIPAKADRWENLLQVSSQPHKAGAKQDETQSLDLLSD